MVGPVWALLLVCPLLTAAVLNVIELLMLLLCWSLAAPCWWLQRVWRATQFRHPVQGRQVEWWREVMPQSLLVSQHWAWPTRQAALLQGSGVPHWAEKLAWAALRQSLLCCSQTTASPVTAPVATAQTTRELPFEQLGW